MAHTIYSRHRLPAFYRFGLAVFWLLPGLILTLVLVYGHGMSAALFDPRFLMLLGLMSLPALYIWQEGIDVAEGGLITRVHIPRYHPYASLSAWRIHREPHGRLVSIWGENREKVYEAHAAHLTGCSLLVAALRQNLIPADSMTATITRADDRSNAE